MVGATRGIHTPLPLQHLPSWGGFTRYFGRNGFIPPSKDEPLPAGDPAQPAQQVLCFLKHLLWQHPVRHPLQHRNVFIPIFSEQVFAKFTFLDGSTRPILPPRHLHRAVRSSRPGLPPDNIAQLLLHTQSSSLHNDISTDLLGK